MIKSHEYFKQLAKILNLDYRLCIQDDAHSKVNIQDIISQLT